MWLLWVWLLGWVLLLWVWLLGWVRILLRSMQSLLLGIIRLL